MIQRFAHLQPQCIRREWFGDELEAGFCDLVTRDLVVIPRHQQYPDSRTHAGGLPGHFMPIHSRHDHVTEDEVDSFRVGLAHMDGFFTARMRSRSCQRDISITLG